jgi:hypothetical protein
MQLSLTVVSSHENDLVKSLLSAGYKFELLEDSSEAGIQKALEETPSGGGVIILADDYPARTAKVTKEHLDSAKRRNLKLLIEYPKSLHGYSFGEPATILYERLIVSNDFLSSEICGSLGPEKDTIMTANGCYFLPAETKEHFLCLARAAGYDKIVFGLPEKVYPVLFKHKDYPDVLISAACLSCFLRARYAPSLTVRNMIQALLYWVCGEKAELRCEYDSCASYGKDDPLPEDYEYNAIRRNLKWLHDYCIYNAGGEKGVIEGFESAIDCTGSQYMRHILRADCLGEAAMAMAVDGWLHDNPQRKDTAVSLMNHLFGPKFYHDNPKSPMYGLINWFENGLIFYGDDNARLLLGALVARSLLNNKAWDEKILRCVYANLRTSGRYGFRHNALRDTSFVSKNWTDYFDEDLIFYSPHYTAYLWAVYLWAYALTGREILKERAETALRMCMEVGSSGWRWQNSLSGEIARMVLPLAFLVRVDDTREHRSWLEQAVNELIELMDESGAVQDMFGDLSLGKYPPPQSNERYGTAEASLIQENGDPATDLLYTTNWAFIGLHEAGLILDDPRIKAACDKLAEFLCRIQVKSKAHPKLDGAWMRSFDFKKWEYWGSSADIGWGAWCIETGWVNTWISTTLALRHMGCSLMFLKGRENFRKIAPEIEADMLTDQTDAEFMSNNKKSAVKMPGSE